jgi:hypothetical protein
LLVGGAGAWLRASGLAAGSFANDEAWVALSTRVSGWAQFWLAVSTTPLAWAGLLKADALVLAPTEATLRAVPLTFGCLTMLAAYLAGARHAGHRIGGLAALAVVAIDPLSIWYAKFLKQYTAEAFFCVLALDRAAAFAASRTPRDLLVLLLVLALGLPFSNAQLAVAPAVLAALLADAAWRRDRQTLRRVLLGALAVGAWYAVYHWLAIAPRLPVASNPYWHRQTYLPPSIDAAAVLWKHLSWPLARALGWWGIVAAGICLMLGIASPRRRVATLALLLLVVEVAGLSMLRRVPVSQSRLLLFLTTAFVVYGTAAVVSVVVRAWARPALGVVATAALALLGRDFVRAHPWRTRIVPALEDAGPLVRLVERERRDAPLILHGKTMYVFAYYADAAPVADRLPTVAVGWVPRIADPSIRLVNDRTLAAAAKQTLASSPRAWLLASRLGTAGEKRLLGVASTVGTIARTHRRRGALLLEVAAK